MFEISSLQHKVINVYKYSRMLYFILKLLIYSNAFSYFIENISATHFKTDFKLYSQQQYKNAYFNRVFAVIMKSHQKKCVPHFDRMYNCNSKLELSKNMFVIIFFLYPDFDKLSSCNKVLGVDVNINNVILNKGQKFERM